jgi:hypothetical protein
MRRIPIWHRQVLNLPLFLKYGDYSIAYSTGIPNISFPIYTINTRELTFPIALSYYAGGIKVGESSSWAGLGWTLKAEGVVNYTIQSLPDQMSFDLPTSDELRNIQDVSTLGKIFSYSGSLSKIDRMRDRYDFSFAEQRGSFMMKDADNSIQLPYTTNKIKRIHSANGVVTQGFVITTDNGTSYYFEEPEMSIVQSVDYNQGSAQTKALIDEYTYTSCWHLTKIISRNGTDVILFSYDIDTNSYYDYSLSQGCSLTQKIGSPATIYPSYDCYMTLKKTYRTPILKAINFDGGKIIFAHSNDRTDARKFRLVQIQVLDNSENIIKSVDFTQSKFSGGQLKLDKISYKGRNDKLFDEYSFSYLYEGIVLPALSGSNWPIKRVGVYDPFYSQDFFGYYNGKRNISLLHTLPQNPYATNFDSIKANRSYSANYASIYTLNKIKYITGGESEFIYGGAQDSKDSIGHSPALRIEKIISSKSANASEKNYKFYRYYNSASFGPSDEMGLYASRNYSANFTSNKNDVTYYVTQSASSDPLMPGYEQSRRVRYNKVEVLSLGSSLNDTIKEVYEYENEPIIKDFERGKIRIQYSRNELQDCMDYELKSGYSGTLFWSQDLNANNICGYVIDNTWTDSYLTGHSIYKQNSNKTYRLIQKTTSQYQCFNRDDKVRTGMYLKGLQFTESGYGSYTGVYDYCRMVNNYYFFDTYASTGWKKLISSTEDNMDGDTLVRKVTNYQYSAINSTHPFVTSMTEKFGVAGQTTHTFNYVYDMAASDSLVKKRMIEQNFIAPVIKEVLNNSGGQTTPIIIEKENDYGLFGSSSGGNIFLKHKSESITKFETMPYTKTGIYESTVNNFDMKGNPVQVTDEKGLSTVYLWSYNYTYLVAKIQNATLNDVLSKLGTSLNDIASSAGYPSQIDVLRGKMPDSQIWTYTYLPLIGKIAETNPSGLTSYYKYDDCNRLNKSYLIINGIEKPICSYDYHYQNH